MHRVKVGYSMDVNWICLMVKSDMSGMQIVCALGSSRIYLMVIFCSTSQAILCASRLEYALGASRVQVLHASFFIRKQCRSSKRRVKLSN